MGFVVAAIIVAALAHYGWQRRAARDVVFRAVVEDRSFGGTGIVWFRVWPGLAGKMGEELEVNWEKMPARATADEPPLEEGWWTGQLELLRRIKRGETTFR